VGALGHYLEQEGLATAGISLIRPHTEAIRPPRALWVPFELGRPLGAPDDAAFQHRVLTSLLALLEAERGPVLADFPDDAPGQSAAEAGTAWACPVSFDRPAGETTLGQAVRGEIGRLLPWYDLARERRGRSTFGAAGLTIEDVAGFLIGWAEGAAPASPRVDLSPARMLKLAAEELKAFYMEAATAQPGSRPGGQALADWFWGETSAARLLLKLREVCLARVPEDAEMEPLARNYLVPRAQWSRLGIDDRWWR
jgi:hypothetical protein